MDNNRYTQRVMKIFEICKTIASEYGINYINSIVFFIASLRLNESVLKELNELYASKIQSLEDLLDQSENSELVHISEINFKGSFDFNEILIFSKLISEKYKQSQINEGNIIAAILRSDSQSTQYLSDIIDVQKVLGIASSARDLLVNLNSAEYTPYMDSRVVNADEVQHSELLCLIKMQYGSDWTESVKYSLEKNENTVFVAKVGDEIMGFATYNSSDTRKGVFGPMGVFSGRKGEGIGKALLDSTLFNMKRVGYQYVIIGQAGPIEFYEKCCNAKLIPF